MLLSEHLLLIERIKEKKMSTGIKIKHKWNMLRFYLSFMLLSFYLTISFLFIFTDMWKDLIPNGRGIIGAALLLFGAFRFYIAYRRYRTKKARIQAIKSFKKKSPVE